MLVRHETYDKNGLVKVEFFEDGLPSIEEQIQQKEEQLIQIYEEIQQLKLQQNNNQ